MNSFLGRSSLKLLEKRIFHTMSIKVCCTLYTCDSKTIRFDENHQYSKFYVRFVER